MKKLYLSIVAAMVATLLPSFAAAQSEHSNIAPLSNKDIILMVGRNVETETIIKTIRTSPCTFDTFPPLLREMKGRGVPESVLQAMLEAPYGPSLQSNSRDDLADDAPIYHYAEQLKQLGYISPMTTGRRSQSRRTRSARSRILQ